MKKTDRYTDIRFMIRFLFQENSQRYGYRRIYGLLRRRKYNSYQGEISPSVANRIEQDFHADKPNHKWLTDITEFALPAGKVYLSVLVDYLDGMLPGWMISTTLDSVLVNSMLDKAISRLPEKDHPLVHSDRGCHYR